MDNPTAISTARQYADAAIASIAEFGLAPTPQNFTVWFSYHAGRQPDLRHAIDTMRADGIDITEAECRDFYRIFFENDSADGVVAAGTRIAETMEQVSNMVGQAGSDTSRFGDALAGITGNLTSTSSNEQVRGAAADLLTETKAMQEQNARFRQQLLESNREIDTLRENLDVARTEAMTDSLTGLMNRRFIDDALQSSAGECISANQPLSILMLDVDHFKNFNDTYGHQLGDVVLKQVARCLTSSTKGRDLVGRYGGEEFMIILPNTDLDGAISVGDEILRTVAGKRIVLKSSGESLGKITLSAGAASLSTGETVASLTVRADDALYAAKANGRNRVESGSDQPAVKIVVPA